MRKFSVIPMKAALAIAMLLMTGNSLAQDNSVYVPRNSVTRIYNNQSDKMYQRNYNFDAGAVESVRPESHAATFLLRTNGLYDLALSPNIGLEWQSSFGLAFQFDYVGAWWNSPSKNRFFSNYGFQTEIRYYFKHKNTANLSGVFMLVFTGRWLRLTSSSGVRAYSVLISMMLGVLASLVVTHFLSAVVGRLTLCWVWGTSRLNTLLTTQASTVTGSSGKTEQSV